MSPHPSYGIASEVRGTQVTCAAVCGCFSTVKLTRRRSVNLRAWACVRAAVHKGVAFGTTLDLSVGHAHRLVSFPVLREERDVCEGGPLEKPRICLQKIVHSFLRV